MNGRARGRQMGRRRACPTLSGPSGKLAVGDAAPLLCGAVIRVCVVPVMASCDHAMAQCPGRWAPGGEGCGSCHHPCTASHGEGREGCASFHTDFGAGRGVWGSRLVAVGQCTVGGSCRFARWPAEDAAVRTRAVG